MFSKTDDLLEALINRALQSVEVAWGAGGYFSISNALNSAEDVFWQTARQKQVCATTPQEVGRFVEALQNRSATLRQSVLNSVRTAVWKIEGLGPRQREQVSRAVEEAVQSALRGVVLVTEKALADLQHQARSAIK